MMKLFMRTMGSHVLARRLGLARGYTLVELSISVAIAGVVSFAGLAYVPQLYDELEVSRFNQRLSGWMLATERYFLARYDYKGLSLQSLVDLGLLDQERIELDPTGAVATVRHLYGGPFSAAAIPALGNQFWGVHLSGIPAKACMPVLLFASDTGRQVLMVPEATGATALADWLGSIAFNASRTSVTNFPAGYRVVKDLNGTMISISDMINLCGELNGHTMGMALIRKKM